jgi:hypothetical protein
MRVALPAMSKTLHLLPAELKHVKIDETLGNNIAKSTEATSSFHAHTIGVSKPKTSLASIAEMRTNTT